MTVKEKLAELLESSPYLDVLGGRPDYEKAADYLIDNGVTLYSEAAMETLKKAEELITALKDSRTAGRC